MIIKTSHGFLDFLNCIASPVQFWNWDNYDLTKAYVTLQWEFSVRTSTFFSEEIWLWYITGSSQSLHMYLEQIQKFDISCLVHCSTSIATKTTVTWDSSTKYCVHKWMAELKYGCLATPYPRTKTLDGKLQIF